MFLFSNLSTACMGTVLVWLVYGPYKDNKSQVGVDFKV